MTPSPTPDQALPTPAATVVMLRDGAEGLEVFMIRRHEKSSVHGGAYVFPGGKVDPADDGYRDGMQLDQPPAELQRALADPALDAAAAVGLYIAAARETFEECGVLLAHRRGALAVEDVYDGTSRGDPFGEVLQRLDLTVSTQSLLPWSRWITPAASFTSTRRFDTRFFVVSARAGQQALHDDHEAVDSVWTTPRAALEKYWQGDITMVPPQIMSLAHLSRHARSETVFEEARAQGPYLVRPMPLEEDGVKAIAYPGDPRHSEPAAVMPGPSRLILRNGRLEPAGGFAALFD